MWGFLIFMLITASFFYLFIAVDAHGEGILAKTRNFLFTTLPSKLRVNGRRFCGDMVIDLIERIITYVCFSNNPII